MANLATVTRPYARAVLSLAQATNSYAQWSHMLNFLTQVVNDPLGNAFVRNLAIGAEEKAKFINELAPQLLNVDGQNLVKVLAHYKRLLIIPELYRSYEEARKEHEREMTVHLFVAKELSSAELEQLSADFAKELNATLTLQQQIDPALIGGGKLKIGDRVLEASIEGNLKALYKELTQ